MGESSMSEELPPGPARPFGLPHPDESMRDIATQLAVIAFWMRFFGVVTVVGIVVSLVGLFVSVT